MILYEVYDMADLTVAEMAKIAASGAYYEYTADYKVKVYMRE